MSGVFGLADSRGCPAAARLDAMGRSLAHFPWYEVDTWTAPEGAGLGRVGTGIFNPEPQPAHDAGGRLHLALAGEVHNAGLLRRELEGAGVECRGDSDAALLLGLYRHDRFAGLGRVEGAFAVAVWDEPADTLVVATDRAGLYPVLYAHFDGRLAFAPEMKAILLDPAFRREFDRTALAEYVRFQCLLGDKTFFTGLRLLPNASILRYHRAADTLARESYWDFSRIPVLSRPPSLPEAAEEAARLLRAAVNRLGGGPRRVGLFLSGGLDSRAILGFLEPVRGVLPTVTYGAPGCRDVLAAQRLATIAGTDHHYFPIADGRWVPETIPLHLELTEGFHSWIHAHGLSELPRVRGLMEVNLSGLHGSELNWEDPLLYEAEDRAAFFNRLFHAMVADTTWPGLTEAEARGLFARGVSEELNRRAFESLAVEVAACDGWSHARQAAHLSFQVDRRLYQYYTLFNRPYVEQRFPFHDPGYVDFVVALPPQYLFQRRLRKAVIFRHAPRLAAVRYDKTDLPILGTPWRSKLAELRRRGEKFVNRHVAAIFRDDPVLFVDYERWLRGELRSWAEAILFDGRLEALGVFDLDAVRSLWARHQSGREANIIGKLAPVMSYALITWRFAADTPIEPDHGR